MKLSYLTYTDTLLDKGKPLWKIWLRAHCFISEPSLLTCTRDNMTMTLQKETYYFFDVSQLHLRYGSCRATENSTHFIISTPLDGCGTLVNETEHALIFWNEVQADAFIIDNVITRTHNFKLPFSCSYSRNTLQSLGFTPQSIFLGYEGNTRSLRFIIFFYFPIVFVFIYRHFPLSISNCLYLVKHPLSYYRSEENKALFRWIFRNQANVVWWL